MLPPWTDCISVGGKNLTRVKGRKVIVVKFLVKGLGRSGLSVTQFFLSTTGILNSWPTNSVNEKNRWKSLRFVDYCARRRNTSYASSKTAVGSSLGALAPNKRSH